MFKLYEWESSESINQQIQKINNSINEVYKKIESTIYDQQKIVKKRTEDINIFHYIPHRTINDIIDKIDKDRWKVMNPDMTYLDLFPKTEVADCFSSMIKSGLKGNCEGRTVLNDLIEYQGFLDKTGFMKKIYDQNRAMEKNTKELETHLRHLFIEKHSLANLSNKFFKININKRKFKDSEKVSKDEGKKLVVQLNDDVIDLILEYLPGYYISRNLDVCFDFYKDNVYKKVCKIIDSIYNHDFVSHLEYNLILDHKEIINMKTKIKNKKNSQK